MPNKFKTKDHGYLPNPIRATIKANGKGWYEFSPCDLGGCIYFCMKGGEVVYVGQSPFSAENRAIYHLKSGKIFDKVIIVKHEGSNRERVDDEGYLISYIRPKYNSSMRKRTKRASKLVMELDPELGKKLFRKMCESKNSQSNRERFGVLIQDTWNKIIAATNRRPQP